MHRILHGLALAALLFTACGGYLYYGYGWCDPYYGGSCYDYVYVAWHPDALAATDFDEDGQLDLAVADRRAGTVWLLRGAFGGGFAPVPSAPLTIPVAPDALALANLDGDGDPDLLVLDGSPGEIAAYEGDGHGGFTRLSPPTALRAFTLGVTRFARGSLDGDAFDDLVTVDSVGGLHVALGTGDGTFTDVGQGDPAASFLGPDAAARLAGVQVALADFDASPGTDLLVLDGERATLAVFSGRGDGTLGPPRAVSYRTMGDVLAIAPATRALGDPADLAVLYGDRTDSSATSTLVVVQLGDGALAFDPMPVGSARSLAARDLDGDGITDLLLTDPAKGAILTLHAKHR